MRRTLERHLHRQIGVQEVDLTSQPFGALRPELSARAWERLEGACDQARGFLDGRCIWSINSTARGGGVAEMNRTLLPYWCGSGLDARWLVIEAPPEFFGLTKRLHNLLHGSPDPPPPGLSDRALFEHVTRLLGAQIVDAVAPGDLVLLHDPQTAGLVPVLKRAGAVVVWRCHVGADRLTEPVEAAWRFLLPFVRDADASVFTRRAFVPPGLDSERVHILAPAIDPCSAKNQALPTQLAQAILSSCGLARATTPLEMVEVSVPDRKVRMLRRCHVLRSVPPLWAGADRLVVALGRWDRLKDPIGIMRGFAQHVSDPDARLIVAGPAVHAVADDPEGESVLAEAEAAWYELPRRERARVQLASLPMADLDENALIANALQRQAAVVVKKSLQEGFGLGVTEAMWKARPVVASRVGGHQDQVEHRRTGLFVDDPGDLAAFGAAVDELLANADEGLNVALAGREQAREHFLADRHFVGWIDTLAAVI